MIQQIGEYNMKDLGDNPIIGSEITNIFGVMNHDSKRNSSLEMDELRAFATCWTRYRSSYAGA